MQRNSRQPVKVFGRDNPYYTGDSVQRASGYAPVMDNRDVQELKDSFNSYVEHGGNGFDSYDEEEDVISEIKDKAPQDLPNYEVVEEFSDNKNVMLSFATETISSAKYRYRMEKSEQEGIEEEILKSELKINPTDKVKGSDGGYVEFDKKKKDYTGDPVAIGYHYNNGDPGSPKFISSSGEITFNE